MAPRSQYLVIVILFYAEKVSKSGSPALVSLLQHTLPFSLLKQEPDCDDARLGKRIRLMCMSGDST